MSAERVERRLAAILAADVAGYSRLMGQDEAGTLARLRTHRRELIDPKISEHKGRIVKTTGDGLLVEFPSVVEAVACAVAVQRGMAERNAETPEDKRIQFRVGINLGDVIVEDGDIHGDGVNVAARLEALAEPGGICVSATVRDHIGDRLDVAFDDLGEQALKNIARPVRVYAVRLVNAARTPTVSLSESQTVLTLPDKPSIAVLPFQNMSGDPEQEYFADGMVEEIITALSRIHWLFVLARNSSFTYKGQHVDVKQVGRELGVRYALEGSVRKGGNRVRITAQLIDAETGAHLWADRFDGSLADVFDLQDQVAASVAGVIEPALQAAETQRSSRRPTTDLTAYDLYLRAYAIYLSSSRQIPQLLDLLEQAIARDPAYGPALALAALCCFRLVLDGWKDISDTRVQNGPDFARRALQAAGDDPSTVAQAALALSFFGTDIDTMMELIDRTLLQNPNFARGWYLSGNIRILAGHLDVAIEHIEKAMRLAPRARVGWPFNLIGLAHCLARRFDQAVPKLLFAMQEDPTYPDPYRTLAVCYAHLGRLDDAREIVQRLQPITEVLLPANFGFMRKAEHRELLISGLQLASADALIESKNA